MINIVLKIYTDVIILMRKKRMEVVKGRAMSIQYSIISYGV